jgi:catechol 2,3-dioxygenase-like lactoylglutathione lyase family enzyme
MLKGIDHLVIVVTDLDQAAKDFAELGFTVVAGGKHPVGSHNVLISFADGSYLEIIAFYREAADHRWWNPLSKGERLVDFCMQTDDLSGDTKKLRDAGVLINDPVPWSRARPDGFELRWLLSLAQGRHRGIAPFLIQDVTPRQERIPQQVEHENGATGIASLIIAVNEIAELKRWYTAVLGKEGEPIRQNELHADGVRFIVGPHALEFLRPLDPRSPLNDWIGRFGPSPYSATLRSRERRRQRIDPRLSHGANLSFA